MKKIFLFSITLLFAANASNAQSFYDVNTIQNIYIYFGFTNWDYRMDTAVAGGDTYTTADSVIINGSKFTNCGVRYKGNSSYNVNRAKNPLHVKLDHVISQNYQGYKDLKLSNGFSDPSMQREVLSYQVLRQYMDAPLSNFTKVFVNGGYYGIMTNDQNMDTKFLDEHYFSSKYTQVKCNPVNVMNGNGSNLGYLGSTVTSYTTQYDLKSSAATGWNELINLCDTLNNNSTAIPSILDIDRVLWMLAFNDVLVNLDSYSGSFRQNYYLYKDHLNVWLPSIWDLNQSFGSFTMAGGTVGNLNLTTMKSMSPIIHKTETGWPLINKLLNMPMYERMYIAHMRTINNENFLNANYKISANAFQTLIDPAVQSDANYLSTYANFQTALTTTNTGGMGSTVGIYTLMDGRATYLNSTSQFTAATPTITAISSGTTTPVYGSTVAINASVSNCNSNAVYLGYRYKKQDHFTRVAMFDDGAHNDGAAGDNVYGALLPVNSLVIQYYLYAENSSAGMFAPERAEHEFYTLQASIQMATISDLAINEYAANNSIGITNEDGKYKDWIEIYNKTSSPLGLSNLYLSDSLNTLSKWKFPATAFLPANGFMLVWADDKDSVLLEYHTNFNLSTYGDAVILSDAATIGDSVTFSSQFLNQVNARCPDGTGVFVAIGNPTPRASNNCMVGIAENKHDETFTIYPNPTTGNFTIESSTEINKISIYNLSGQVVFEVLQRGTFASLDLSFLNAGVYFVRINNSLNKKLVIE